MPQSVLKILTHFIYVDLFFNVFEIIVFRIECIYEFFKTLPKNTRKALHLDLNSQAIKEIFNSYFPL